MHTDLVVGKYWGEMGVDFWDAATWEEHLEKHEVVFSRFILYQLTWGAMLVFDLGVGNLKH